MRAGELVESPAAGTCLGDRSGGRSNPGAYPDRRGKLTVIRACARGAGHFVATDRRALAGGCVARCVPIGSSFRCRPCRPTAKFLVAIARLLRTQYFPGVSPDSPGEMPFDTIAVPRGRFCRGPGRRALAGTKSRKKLQGADEFSRWCDIGIWVAWEVGFRLTGSGKPATDGVSGLFADWRSSPHRFARDRRCPGPRTLPSRPWRIPRRLEEPTAMLHFSCDICGKDLTPEGAARFVVKMEAFAATDPAQLTEDDLDTDHVEEMAQLLNEIEDGEADEPEVLPVCKKMRFDLCPMCY